MCSCNDPECPQCHVHKWKLTSDWMRCPHGIVRWKVWVCACGEETEDCPDGWEDPRELDGDYLRDKARDDAPDIDFRTDKGDLP